MNAARTAVEYGLVYVEQENFETYKPGTLQELTTGFREYKAGG